MKKAGCVYSECLMWNHKTCRFVLQRRWCSWDMAAAVPEASPQNSMHLVCKAYQNITWNIHARKRVHSISITFIQRRELVSSVWKANYLKVEGSQIIRIDMKPIQKQPPSQFFCIQTRMFTKSLYCNEYFNILVFLQPL